MEASMKKILLLTAISGSLLAGCYSTEINMSMGNMRLISSSANPQDVMDFATKACKNDFYQGASFLSKAGKEYRFKCVKAEENEVLIPIPGTTIESTPKADSK
jgi:DNA relaxase NicK